MTDHVTTRIAPSPTGHLHIGTARTALFNYLFAKKTGGRFIVRSEDTDKARSLSEYETEILEGLEWLGLTSDEFYRQSERSEIYQNHLETLIENGAAYLSKERGKNDTDTMVEVVRLKNSSKVVTFRDEIRGDISVDTADLGDFVIARSLDDALYHFTVVVDDYLSNVTHVIRGEDHISNTPRQILIQEAIGAPRPIYAHLPLILAPDRSKMSKRHGAVSIAEYRREGFLPEAIVNYLALLGWHPEDDEELFTLDELARQFELVKVQKGGAIFDREKFIWFNREHILHMSDESLVDCIEDWLPEQYRNADVGLLSRLLPLVRERTRLLSDITREVANGELTFAFEKPDVAREMLKWKGDADVRDALPRLERAIELIANLPGNPTTEEARGALWDYAEEVGRGELLWPLRVALTGKERSPDPFSVIMALGREESLERVSAACDKIKSA